MQQFHLQQLSRRDIYATLCKILLMLFCILTSYIKHSDYLVLIWKILTIPQTLHDVKNFLNKRALSSKHVSIFYREFMTSFLNYVTATLRALFAWRGSNYKAVSLHSADLLHCPCHRNDRLYLE